MEFRLPELGEGITEATVVNIPLKAGDSVSKGQTLVDVETDKASMSLPADSAGKVTEIRVKPGAKVKVGDVLLVLSGGASPPPAPKPASANSTAKTAPPAEVKATPSVSGQRYEFALPNLGEGIESGMVVSIAIKPGDTLSEGQETMTVETDKASMPVSSPVAGKVEEIKVKVGQKIPVGTVVAILSTQAQSKTPTTPAPKPTPAAAGKPQQPSAPTETQPAPTKHTSNLPVPAGPATRRYAREHGVTLQDVEGTARGGRVTVGDVITFIRGKMSEPSSAPSTNGVVAPPLPDFTKFGPVERKPFSTRRQAIAKNLTISWHTAPAVTQFDSADITDLEAGRKRISETLAKGAPKITMTVLAIKAVVAALKEFTNFNASLDMGAGELVYKQYYHIGIAVDTPQGLVVPVIRDADKKSIRDLAKDISELAEKARAGKLTIDEMRGGSFTITNLGGIGGTAFSPIINYPEVAILGLARSAIQPQYRDGKFEPRLMMPLCLTYDHRVIDGADGARFTTRLVQLFSDPIRLLMES